MKFNQFKPPQKASPRLPVRPPAPITPARKAAFEILTVVSAGKGHSDDLLHSAHTAGLSLDDRNLTTAIVMGVLRWQIALDAQLAGLLARPDQKLAEPLAIVLRMGAFQLLHMDRIPAHAALSESVELCRAAGQPHAAGMVNAILRKVAVSKSPGKLVFESTPILAQRLGHPAWLVERWVAKYGRAAAVRICEFDQQVPGRGGLFAANAEPQSSAGSDTISPHTLPQIDDGSRLIAELAAVAAPQTAHRARVWDCCAAPGGKTLLLAARLPDADIFATDVSARRSQQMQARLRGAPVTAQVRTAVIDASASCPPTEGDDQFDLILCDVPCTGTGTLARNPEIRHRLRPEELSRQAQRQIAILTNALRCLAPGGRLLYSTCSLEPEENEAVIETVSRERYRQLPITPLLNNLADQALLQTPTLELLIHSAVTGNALRTLPGTHPCDGFYATLLERI